MGKINAYVMVFLFILIMYTLFFHDVVFDTYVKKSSNIPDFVFHDIVISHFIDGVVTMEVSTDRAVINKGETDILLGESKGVRFFQDSFLRFNADHAMMDLSTGGMHLENPYMVFSYVDELYWFNSSDISWIPSDNFVLSDSNVQIMSSKFRIVANDMQWNMDNHHIYFSDYPRIFLKSYYEN